MSFPAQKAELVPALLRRPAGSSELPVAAQSAVAQVEVRLIESEAELRAAQKLRFDVFAGEYGAQLSTPVPGLDIDVFDSQCDHLVALDAGQVVGCYRILRLTTASRLGSSYLAEEFFVTRLARLLPQLVEFGRTCVHPDYRNTAVLLAMWSGLAKYMQTHDLRYAVGCASVSLADGGANARATWNAFQEERPVDALTEVFPINRLPISRVAVSGGARPPLISGYSRMNAFLIGEPAWDPDFGTADFPLMLDIQALPPRYAKHFSV
jgi:putative hemolysin